jgi:hypothetical protein
LFLTGDTNPLYIRQVVLENHIRTREDINGHDHLPSDNQTSKE